MPLHMQRQMIRSTERTLTQIATERFLSSMFPIVSSQFIRTGKFPRTTIPGTLIRFLPYKTHIKPSQNNRNMQTKTCMSPLMRFQMRTFRVNLVTTGNIATVHFPPTQNRILTTFPILKIIIIIVVIVAWRCIASRYNPTQKKQQLTQSHFKRLTLSRYTYREVSLIFWRNSAAAAGGGNVDADLALGEANSCFITLLLGISAKTKNIYIIVKGNGKMVK